MARNVFVQAPGLEVWKRDILIDAVKTRSSLIKAMGYSNAVAFCITIFGIIGALWMYLFNKDLNGYAVLGMFGVLTINLVLFGIASYMATDA